MSEIIQPLILPSWDLGNIARGLYEAAFPELWEGLVGYWDPSLGPTGLTLFDIVNGNNGQLTNMVAADDWVVGERGYALDYDADGDEVSIPFSAKLYSMRQLSLCAWVKYEGNTTTATEKNVFSAWAAGNTNYLLRWNPDINSFGFFTDTSSGIAGGDSFNDINIEDGNWHLVIAVYDGVKMKLYVDGQKDSTEINQTGTIANGLGSLAIVIGGYQGGVADFWVGKIGPVSIYSIALPENRIRLMAAGATPAMLAEDVVLKAPAVGGLLLKQSNMDGGMMNLNGGFA